MSTLVEKKTITSLFPLKRLLSNKSYIVAENLLSSIDREGGSISIKPPTEEAHFGNNIANTTPYYNMILCHSLAINDELIFTKYNRKIHTRQKEDSRDRQAQTLYETFKGKSLAEAIDMTRFKTIQDHFDLAMQMSIET